MRPRLMHRREVVAFTLDATGATVYVTGRSQWDAAWYSTDINRAKVWRSPGTAAVTAHRLQRDGVATARVIDPRSVPGYIDKPSRAAREQAGYGSTRLARLRRQR